MLTKESQSLIDSFLGKTDIESFLKDSSLKLFYHSLSKNSYKTSKVKITHGTKLFPQSNFLANSLSKKIQKRQNVLTMKWTIFSKYNIHCILHIYLKENEKFPDTELLMRAISFITSFSDKERKFNIH